MSLHAFRSALAPPPPGPASAAVSTGPLVFVSGQLPDELCEGAHVQALLGRGGEPGGSAAGQARLALANLARQLRATGLGLDRVASLTIHLVDPDDLEAVDQVCREVFGEPYPARTVVGAAWLPCGARVQVSAVAVRY